MEVLIGVIGVVIGVIASFYSARYGADVSHRRNIELARDQKAEADAAAQEAFLRHLQEEFTANGRILWEISTYLKGGAPIPELFDPPATAASYLRFHAWDALVRAGVLPGLERRDQALFRVSDRASRRAAQDVATVVATWKRAFSWQRWNHAQIQTGELVQGIPLDELRSQSQRHIKDPVVHAMERIDEALARLKELLPEEEQSAS